MSRFSRFSDTAPPGDRKLEDGSQGQLVPGNGSSIASIAEASSAATAAQSLLADIDAMLATTLPAPVCLLSLAVLQPLLPQSTSTNATGAFLQAEYVTAPNALHIIDVTAASAEELGPASLKGDEGYVSLPDPCCVSEAPTTPAASLPTAPERMLSPPDAFSASGALPTPAANISCPRARDEVRTASC